MGAIAWVFAWLAFAVTPPARQEKVTPPTIVLVSTPEGADQAWPVAQSRLQAELLAAGFRVLVLSNLSDDDPPAQARDNGAVAVVRAQRDGSQGRVDVWLAQPDIARSDHYGVVRQGATSRAVADEVALQAVERLHASFIELPAAAAVEPKPPEPEPVLVPPARPRERAFRVGIRARWVAAGSPGGMGPMLGGGLGTVVFFRPQIGLDLDAYVVAAVRPLSRPGSASTVLARQGSARLHVVWRPLPVARISPTLGAGVGIVVPWAAWRAAPEANLDAQRKVGLVALPSIRTGIAVRLAQQLTLELAVQAGFSVTRIVIYDEFGGPMASAGRPLIDGGIGLVWTPAR